MGDTVLATALMYALFELGGELVIDDRDIVGEKIPTGCTIEVIRDKEYNVWRVRLIYPDDED